MDSPKETLSKLQQEAQKAFSTVADMAGLEAFFDTYLSKKSEIAGISKQMKSLTLEEKKEIGQLLTTVRRDLESKYEAKKSELGQSELNEKLKNDWIDVTKALPRERGALHPLSQVQRRVEEIFVSMGFTIADGPEVETEWYNFDALNVPGTHPARDMQDTFWIKHDSESPHENTVLRTQTSNVQIRMMQKYGAPVRLVAPGRVFRNEATDMTHEAQFYQVEGLVVDKGISLAHLKGTIKTMLSELFEKEIKIRFRPGYFPFVEPGLEVDIWFEFTDRLGRERAMWMEFMGAGMVHPNVLRNCNVDPEQYSGFAFGFGLSRLTMMKYGIDDLRYLSSQKKDFLSQF